MMMMMMMKVMKTTPTPAAPARMKMVMVNEEKTVLVILLTMMRMTKTTTMMMGILMLRMKRTRTKKRRKKMGQRGHPSRSFWWVPRRRTKKIAVGSDLTPFLLLMKRRSGEAGRLEGVVAVKESCWSGATRRRRRGIQKIVMPSL